MNNKYSQKRIDSAKKPTTDGMKTVSKRTIQKTAEATGDLIGNKVADMLTSISKSLKNASKSDDKEIYIYIYIFTEKRQEIIDELGLCNYITMEYQKNQKVINLLNNTPNQLSKFRTKNWIKINDQSGGVYNTSSDIRFRTTMLKSRLCDCSDAYIFVKGRITVTGTGGAVVRQADEINKGVIFKICVPFINCKSEINNAEMDNVKDIDTVMPMYNLTEYSDNYSKTSIWKLMAILQK